MQPCHQNESAPKFSGPSVPGAIAAVLATTAGLDRFTRSDAPFPPAEID
jgi:hypothetical protein